MAMGQQRAVEREDEREEGMCVITSVKDGHGGERANVLILVAGFGDCPCGGIFVTA